MAKVIRSFRTKPDAMAFEKKMREKFPCITFSKVYMSSGHYHTLLSGDITPEVADQLKGTRGERGFKYEP